MGYAERAYDIQEAAGVVLDGRTAPMPTRVLAEKVARSLGLDPDNVGLILLRLAPTDPRATHNGETRMRFGKRMTGWLWHATPQVEGSVMPKAELSPAVAPLFDPMSLPEGSVVPVPGRLGYSYLRLSVGYLEDTDENIQAELDRAREPEDNGDPWTIEPTE